MTKVQQVFGIVVATWAILLPFICTVNGAAKLASYNVNISLSSVSGLSSGGYFAVQMHVAYSSIFRGAAVFAGGPYHCAKGSMTTALTDCMQGTTPPSLDSAISTTNSYASSGKIDSTAYLDNARVFLFSGTSDTTVKPAVMNVLHKYYQHYVKQGNVEYFNTFKAAHTMPTDDRVNTNACTTAASPYISYCDFDGAGQGLQEIFDDSLLPRNDGSLTGSFIEFDQTEFLTGKSFGTVGWLYVPKACASGASCLLHVSFHGCLQTLADIGDKWVKNTGFNKWADTNNIIVLYPQAQKSSSSPLNPNGCWDWWGYNNAANYDTKTGDQMKAVRAMIDRIGKGFVSVPPPSGVQVTATSDASISLSWDAVSDVAGYNVYRNGVKVTSAAVTLTRYVDGGLQSGTSYSYFVRSVLRSGAESVPSETVVAATSGNPPPIQPPTGITVTETTSSTVTLTWQAAEGASDYYVFRDGALTANNPVESLTYTDTKLAAESTYTYTLKSLTEIGIESGFSAPVQATTKSAWTCKSFTASNYAQVQAGRAYQETGYCYANGSNDYMGLYNTFTQSTLAETAQGYFIVGNC